MAKKLLNDAILLTSDLSSGQALYYNALAMINCGGKKWTDFSAMFLPEVLNAQNQDGAFKDTGAAANGKSGPPGPTVPWRK